MNKKIVDWIWYLFLFLFLLFPFQIIHNSMFITIYLIFMVLMFFIVKWEKIKLFQNKKMIWALFITVFIIRLIAVLILNNRMVQVSDFLGVYNNASNFNFPTFYYQIANHYLLYTYIIGILFKLFGASQILALLFNVLVTSGVSIFLYLICEKICKNKAFGCLALLIYAFWPVNILYTCILSPDHIAMLFIVLSIYLVLKIIELIQSNNFKDKWPLFIATGISISFISFFKNFSPVFLIAILIVFIIINIEHKKKILLIRSIFVSTLIIVTYLFSNFLIYKIEDNIVGAKVLRNQFYQYAYVGLGLENKGTYSVKRYNEYHNYLKSNNMNIKETEEYFSQKIISEIKNNLHKYPDLIKHKINLSFGDDSAKLWWVRESIFQNNNNSKMLILIDVVIQKINQYYYIFIVVFVTIGVIYNCHKGKNVHILFISVVVYGCCLLLLFVESQGRYRYAFEPLLCILAAYGICYGKILVSNFIKNIQK